MSNLRLAPHEKAKETRRLKKAAEALERKLHRLHRRSSALLNAINRRSGRQTSPHDDPGEVAQRQRRAKRGADPKVSPLEKAFHRVTTLIMSGEKQRKPEPPPKKKREKPHFSKRW